ncbi:protein DA1-related 1-like [Lycium barbarum]|uniref:protein DA1-related 1-like n=1 Tax=Lycium barbarum TaxID=112863 RepID=UPI00293E80DD|nr:protein DA1-related 1-like [Lycium barbarum]
MRKLKLWFFLLLVAVERLLWHQWFVKRMISKVIDWPILAHEMLHAWLRLKGYPSLSPEVEEGTCQVLAHIWLDSEIIAGSGSSSTSASSSASSSSSTSSKKGNCSEFEKKLGDFFKHQLNQIPQQLMGMDSEEVC